MRKICLTISVVFIFSIASFGQIAFGPKFTYGQSRINNYEQFLEPIAGSDINNGFLTGVQIGLAARIGWGRVSFQPEVLYSQMGTEVEFPGRKVDYLRGYIQAPMMANFTTFQKGAFRLYILGGPYAGFAVNTRATIFQGGTAEQVDTEFDFDDENNDGISDRRWDFGAAGGLGLHIDNILVEARLLYGLTNIVSFEGVPEPDYNLRNFAFGVSVGYLFFGDVDDPGGL